MKSKMPKSPMTGMRREQPKGMMSGYKKMASEMESAHKKTKKRKKK